MSWRSRSRLVAASFVGVVASGFAMLGFTTAPAHAATCAPGSGVSVVVEFREVGNGTQTACAAAGAGKSAAALFSGEGFPLTYASRQPGFVCRVSGVPTSDPCVNTSPTTAYWGLYWSDGKSGEWAYSTLGVSGLTVPEGGSVAFAWQGSGVRGAPSVAPPRAAQAPSEPAPSVSAPPPATQAPATTSTSTRPTSRPTTKVTTTTGNGPQGTAPTVSPSPRATSSAVVVTPPANDAAATGSSPTASTSSAEEATDSATTTEKTSAAEAAESGATLSTTLAPAADPSGAVSGATETDTGAAPQTPAAQAVGGSLPLPIIVAVLVVLAGTAGGAVVLRNRRA